MNSMIQRIFIFIVTIFFALNGHSQNWAKYSVVLGERNLNEKIEAKENNCEVITVRLDGEGNYYPNLFIKDKSMKKSQGTLSNWYKNNPGLYNSVLEGYGILNSSESLDLLNAAIEKGFVELIDSRSVNKEIVFLIHGYRKQMYEKKDNSLSTVDNDNVENQLGSDKLFVEVYWDSKHMTIFQGVFGKRGLKMLEASATPNAKNVGAQLRTLVSAVSKQKISIICHSLGSVVANELSFNYKHQESLMDGKRIKAVYLGPAIGYESFKNSSLRGSGNYELKTCIGYNEDDIVLRKYFRKFGIRIKADPTTYGNTSLGCNYKGDIDKLLKMYQSDLPNEHKPLLIDMSGSGNHYFTYYAGHDAFSQIMMFLFED